jgi:hypothetical protein
MAIRAAAPDAPNGLPYVRWREPLAWHLLVRKTELHIIRDWLGLRIQGVRAREAYRKLYIASLRWSAALVTGSHNSLLIVHAATALYLAWIGSQVGVDRTSTSISKSFSARSE